MEEIWLQDAVNQVVKISWITLDVMYSLIGKICIFNL